MPKQRVTAFLALLLCLPVFAEQWEGNAARIRPGELTSPGLLAASNSFPEGSRVRVSSARTGRSVDVTVARRIDGTTGVFLLLSDQAADALGLAAGDVERVVAQPVAAMPTVGASVTEKKQDLDDPRAGLGTLREELKAAEAQASAAAPEPAVAPPAAADAPAVAAAPAPAQPAEAPAAAAEEPPLAAVGREPQEQPSQPPQEAASPPAVAQAPQPPAPAEPGLAESVSRAPQKQLFLPPREEEVAAAASGAPPTAPAPKAAAAAVEAAPEVTAAPPRGAEAPLLQPLLATPEPPAAPPAPAAPEPPSVSEAPPVAPVPAPLVRTVQEPPLPEPAAVAAAPQPQATPERPPGTLALSPTEARPPQGPAPGPAAEAPPAPAQAPAARVALIAPPSAGERTYFIQLGAFSDEASAREVERRLGASYPVGVQTGARNGRSLFRVVVGPLGRDETGSTLLRFQRLGFRDAFVRAVN